MNEFSVIGISYKKANETIRGAFSLSSENKEKLQKILLENNIHSFIISTCNRTEVYATSYNFDFIIESWAKVCNQKISDLNQYTYFFKKNDSLKHIFNVGCGLESQILGDFEITSQLKKAFADAKAIGASNGYLERLVNAVLRSSKDVRSNTKISNGTTSVSYVTVDYIKNNIPNYTDKKILLYGLGEIGKLTIENLYKHLPSQNLAVINRTESKAQKIAQKFIIKEYKHSQLNYAIKEADILILATDAQNPTITLKNIPNHKEITIFDLSIPKNVDDEVENLPTVQVLGLDQLSKTINETMDIRKNEIPKAKEIANKHIEEFLEWDSHQSFSDLTVSLKNVLLGIKSNEIAYQKKKLKDLNEEHIDIVSQRLIQKITTKFVTQLKTEQTPEAREEKMNLLKEMFNL